MSQTDLFLAALLLAACLVAVALWRRLRRLAAAHRRSLEICERARAGEASVTRILRLFAQELQGLALSLRGHGDQLVAETHPNAPIVAGIAAQLGGLADELEHHLTPAESRRALSCEVIAMRTLIAESVAAISAAISPGCRSWRMPAGDELSVWADRRALRQVLVRVLSEAVRSSGHNDWIDVGCTAAPDGIVLLIEDEGTGTAETCGGTDRRGIGLRLSLARTLMQAHGGTLEVESLLRVGTRVTLTLPPDRLRDPVPRAPSLAHS